MPQLVSELTTGRSFERSAQTGAIADSVSRQWRILLKSPYESFDLSAPPPDGIGVKIGDILDPTYPIPCVSISVAADGSNRMTRLATARYQSTAGDSSNPNDPSKQDPGSEAPDDRLCVVSVNTSLVEMPSWTWYVVNSEGVVAGARTEAVNTAHDMYDGVLKSEPVSVITVEQFDYPTDPMLHIQHLGKVNSNTATWRGLTIPKRTMLFRGLSFRPQNIFWGSTLYRGWQSTYEFVFRNNEQRISDNGVQTTAKIGWDIAVPQTGFNYLDPLAPANAKRKRAMLKLPGTNEEVPSAQPVPLNDDGQLRAENADPKVLVKRRGYHEQGDFSVIFAHLRLAPPPPAPPPPAP